jgi:hypothetical protein
VIAIVLEEAESMSKTFIAIVVVGNAIAAVSATWPLGIPSAIAAGFLAGYALTDDPPA